MEKPVPAAQQQGQRLLMLMERLNMTMEEMGKFLGVTKGTISKYSKGTLRFPGDLVMKLHDKYNYNLNFHYAGKKPLVLTEKEPRTLTTDIGDIILTQSIITSRLDSIDELMAKVIRDLYASKHGV